MLSELFQYAAGALVMVVMYALFVRPFIDMHQDMAAKRKTKRGPSPKELRIAEMRANAADRPCRCGCVEQDRALFG